jgi:hypothetical protein
MSANLLASMLGTSVNDVSEISGMSVDKLVSVENKPDISGRSSFVIM